MHVVTINNFTGLVEQARCFDTHKTSAGLEEFIKNDIPDGYHVAVATQDEVVTKLSVRAHLWLASMGSTTVWKLEFGHGFTFIGT